MDCRCVIRDVKWNHFPSHVKNPLYQAYRPILIQVSGKVTLKVNTGTQSAKKLFSASLPFSKWNWPFYSWHNHDFHIHTFIHFIHAVKQMHKMSGKFLEKNTKLAWKYFFLFPCIIFKGNFQLWGSEMPSCNTTSYQWCVYRLLGLSEDLREVLKINKGPLLGYIESIHLWLPVCLQSIQFQPPYKVWIVRRFLMLCWYHWNDNLSFGQSYCNSLTGNSSWPSFAILHQSLWSTLV